MTQQHYCVFDSAIGACGVAWSEHVLKRLQLPESDRGATEQRLRRRSASAHAAEPPPAIAAVIADVQRYLAGTRVDFSAVAVDLTGVDAFHRIIYEAARGLGWGETASYGEIARQVGAPSRAQAVGQAMGRNPVPIIIPCHRVVASGRRIGGFSAPGGTSTKERLLWMEGVRIRGEAPRLPGL
jgi:methylated-DNA-[protein]-cysteine S-methyltransferase